MTDPQTVPADDATTTDAAAPVEGAEVKPEGEEAPVEAPAEGSEA